MTCWELLCPISKADYTMTFLFPSTAINQYGGKVLFYSDLTRTERGETKRQTSRGGPFSSNRPHMPIDSNFKFGASSKHKLFARSFVSPWNHQPFFAVQKGKLRMNPHLKFRAALFRFFARSCFKTFFPMAWKINENFYFPPPPSPPTTEERASREFSNEKIKHHKIAFESGCSRVDSQGDHKFRSIRKYDVIDFRARGFSQFVISEPD